MQKIVGIQFTAENLSAAVAYIVERLMRKNISKGKWTITELQNGRFKAERKASLHNSLVICGNEVTIVN